MPRPDLHTLLLEQEAAIDDLFEASLASMLARFRRVEQPPTPERVRFVVNSELRVLFGSNPSQALASPIGKVVVAYANAARKFVAQRVVADLQLARGKDGASDLIRAALPQAQMLKEANDRLDPVLALLERPARSASVLFDLVTVETGDLSDPAREMVRAVLHEIERRERGPAHERLRAATIANLATVTAIAHGGKIPKIIDDTSSWTGPDRKRLADRLTEAKNTIQRIINQRFISRFAATKNLAWLDEDLTYYLVARFNPKRTIAGQVIPSIRPGGFTRAGAGKGSFTARRLGRHEATRAYGDFMREVARTSQVTPAIRWVLNPAHPGSDECDDLADGHSDGLPPGCYMFGDVPHYPNHMGCLCSLELVDLQGRRPAERRSEE